MAWWAKRVAVSVFAFLLLVTAAAQPAAAEGAGSLSGTVLSAAGAPVGGVCVQAITNAGWVRQQGPLSARLWVARPAPSWVARWVAA